MPIEDVLGMDKWLYDANRDVLGMDKWLYDANRGCIGYG